MQNYFKSGAWNVICDVCGRKKKNTEVRKRWDGLMVCDKDWESRHIADFIKIKAEKNNVKDPRHEIADQYLDISYISTGDAAYCSNTMSSSIADLATSGCATAGRALIGGL